LEVEPDSAKEFRWHEVNLMPLALLLFHSLLR